VDKSQLTTGALFYGMRSCEFVKVPAGEQQKTRLVEVKDIFFLNSRNEVINQKYKKLKKLATLIETTFSERKFETIAHEQSHAGLCPVETSAERVPTICTYSETTEKQPSTQ
jgi:hypothetical protein